MHLLCLILAVPGYCHSGKFSRHTPPHACTMLSPLQHNLADIPKNPSDVPLYNLKILFDHNLCQFVFTTFSLYHFLPMQTQRVTVSTDSTCQMCPHFNFNYPCLNSYKNPVSTCQRNYLTCKMDVVLSFSKTLVFTVSFFITGGPTCILNYTC